MKDEKNVLGIDIGSVTISLALVNSRKQILQSAYDFHEGRLAEKLEEMLKSFQLNKVCGIAATTSTPKNINVTEFFDNRVSYIAAAKNLHDTIGSLLIVGGEKYGLALFDKDNNYRKYRSNTSCAAGTGSFLDQQAKRLNLQDIAEFADLAESNTGDFPKIATRCSVFAKTDLIHAQQEGYSVPEICDGLCYGLAKNIVDTLFKNKNIELPVIFAGGVSRNKAVTNHIKQITGYELIVSDYSHLYGAIGAAFSLLQKTDFIPENKYKKPADIVAKYTKKKHFFYKPLQLELSDYPDFSSFERYHYSSKTIKNAPQVEVDVYSQLKKQKYHVYLGIDVGSTSTKAMLLDENKQVLGGFYTRTSGAPVNAMRSIFESIQQIADKKQVQFVVKGAGTTGSGRKFIGRIINADITPDEITAHARAAIELDPEVDTILEIGGQDAKFTTLSNGSVSFSAMNNVCAAGTGSFIEEQAKKLGVPLDEYSERAENSMAPIASDRCTVFMERDLNHYINENYTTNEILAAVLHSVRENYLTRVAVEKNIGNNIFFQGATAKNKALVAAFEQKLKRPIRVSKYCHLTGAYGVALELYDKKIATTKFRGLHICKNEIPVRTEICGLCTNHCKYKIADVEGEKVVYGFLCGRDYHSTKFVDNNVSEFNLVDEYKKQFCFRRAKKEYRNTTVGIPAGLYLFDDMYLWQRFFELLNFKTLISKKYNEALKKGKRISGAEFCAPMTAFQGHVTYLLDKTDLIFLPTYLEEGNGSKKQRRQYCYYSQYAPPIVASLEEVEKQNILINPVFTSLHNELHVVPELFRSLKKSGLNGFTLYDVSRAYRKARKEKKEREQMWKFKYRELSEKENKLQVVLLGRPYTVLSSSMNNKIPQLFAQKGVKTFFQDMLGVEENDVQNLKEVLGATKWKFAAAILASADYAARTEGLYPVLISSFKCSPDSFAIEYFKQILDFYKKPYLILQLDEYDSNVGYETRIEAALRAFSNHFNKKHQKEKTTVKSPENIVRDFRELIGKTLLLPNLGDYSTKLIEANLRRIGIDAHTLYDSEDSIKKSLITNTGQCLPLSIIVQNAFDFIEENSLEPANTFLWMMDSPVSCNLGMFLSYISKFLTSQENRFRDMKIYSGKITFADISISTSLNGYMAFLFGGYLRKLECKVRPYEINKGQTDKIVKKSLALFYEVFKNGSSKEEAVKKVIEWFKAIPVKKERRPKVAIFGDLYVRDNDVFNQNLFRCIEDNGGEVITTPYSEYVKIIFSAYDNRLMKEGYYSRAFLRRFLMTASLHLEEKYVKYFNEVLREPVSKPLKNYKPLLEKFNLTSSYNGESLDNALKIIHLKELYPDISLFVQTNPSYCCPSLVTEAMTRKMEKITGTPIVTIEYDGTSAGKNDDIIPYLRYAAAVENKDMLYKF